MGLKPAIDPSELRREILGFLESQGFMIRNGRLRSVDTKRQKQELHKYALRQRQQQYRSFIIEFQHVAMEYLADGSEIDPDTIDPVLVQADSEDLFDLFKWIRLVWWSLPYTAGFGRRLRYVVIDRSNNKVMGLIGLQSPPIDLAARDRRFNYPKDQKTALINQSMDIYTLGGVPPYNQLLSGKLAALLAVSDKVRDGYSQKYSGRRTQMDNRILPANLLFLTTLSAFGRSSIYSRLKDPEGRLLAEPIGYTAGHGTFQFPDDLYERIRLYLKQQNRDTSAGYGNGPRRRMQLIDAALSRLGLPRNLLAHNVKRQVFLFSLVHNLDQLMSANEQHSVIWKDYRVERLVEFWLKRWAIPRSERVLSWSKFDASPYWTEKVLDIKGD